MRLQGHHSDKLYVFFHKIHSATGHDEKWNPLLAEIKELFNSTSASITKHQFSSGHGQRIFQAPIDEQRTIEYNRYFSIRNPWFIASSEYKTGRVMTGDELINTSELKRSDFYRLYLKKHDLFHRLCGVISSQQDHAYVIILHRSKNLPAYDDNDRKLMHQILEHLSLSLNNHWQMINAKGINQMLWSVINHFDHAAFLVETDGSILYQHQDTDKFMPHINGLKISQNKIMPTTAAKRKVLIQALKEMGQINDDEHFEANKIVALTQTHRQQPVIINLRPFGAIYSVQSMDYKKIILLTVKSPVDGLNSLHHCSFAKLFNLTPAQARLCPYVFSGHSLAHAAKALHISENTIRSHLKQIFLKTDTHSQIEVIQLHARLCDEYL